MRLKFIKDGKVVMIENDNGEMVILDEAFKDLKRKPKALEDEEETKDSTEEQGE